MSKLSSYARNSVIVAALTAVPLTGLVYAGNDGDHDRRDNCRHDASGKNHRHGEQEPGKYIDGRTAFLKAEIGITDEQATAWQTVEDAMREGVSDRTEMRGQRKEKRADKSDASAPDRLATHVEAMESRLEHMKNMQAALNDLYAVLTPAQQEVANELLPGFGRKGGRHMR